MTDYNFVTVVIDGAAILILIILIAAIYHEKEMNRDERTYFFWCLGSEMMAVGTDLIACIIEGNPEVIGWLKLLYSLTYVANAALVLFFTLYLTTVLGKRTYLSRTPIYVIAFVCGFNAIISVCSLYGLDYACSVTSDGLYQQGPWYSMAIIVPILSMLYNIILAISCRKYLSKAELFAILSFFVVPVVMSPASIVAPMEFQCASTIVLLLMYIYVCSENSRRSQRQEKQLADAKMKIMVSQIQPHFMYNSLNAIYYLVGKDKSLAKEALKTFSYYLSQNLDSLEMSEPVPFSRELEHVKAYLYLEQLRFEDDLNIIYDIETENFMIPPLTVQPLVENAVKHGIAEKRGGGTLTIGAKKIDSDYVIVVEDDGVGFDMDNPVVKGRPGYGSNSTHVGVGNVRSRLDTMVEGTMYIESEPGKGTKVRISIPQRWGIKREGEQQ